MRCVVDRIADGSIHKWLEVSRVQWLTGGKTHQEGSFKATILGFDDRKFAEASKEFK